VTDPGDRKQQLLALIRAQPSPTRVQRRWRSLMVAAAAVAIALALFFALGGARPGGHDHPGPSVERPVLLMLITSLGAAVLVALALWGLSGRGGSMLGRHRAWLVALSALVVVSLVAWKVVASSQFPDMSDPWPTRPGLRCLGVSLLLGVWPLAALSISRARSDVVHPRATGAALGVTAGACAWLLVDLWCPVAHLGHLLLGHALPIVLFALAGAWIGRRWIAMTSPIPR
jgi:hypothetical protein